MAKAKTQDVAALIAEAVAAAIANGTVEKTKAGGGKSEKPKTKGGKSTKAKRPDHGLITKGQVSALYWRLRESDLDWGEAVKSVTIVLRDGTKFEDWDDLSSFLGS